MKPATIISEDFLLSNRTAKELFHGVAESLPVIDYHCHIDPTSLRPDHRFRDISELWLTADPYKHRAMRINGIPEAEITGPADPKLKFRRWIETLDRTCGNPLHHWSYLELKRFFGRDGLIAPADWESLWDELNAQVRHPACTSESLAARVKAERIVTSDLLCDDLSVHAAISAAAASGTAYSVTPSLRADDILSVDGANFRAFLNKLRTASGIESVDLSSYLKAIETRLDFFHERACRIADHSLDRMGFQETDAATAAADFAALLGGAAAGAGAALRLRSFLLVWLGAQYARRGWILALHLGAQRATSSRLRGLAGASGGFAGIGSAVDVSSLAAYLDCLERAGSLPKTILFTLNPSDNAVLATLTGSFAQDGVPGKIQFGPAWWFNDHKFGITEHLKTLACHGLMERFIGMTTDSRSILSLTRHEYFRRIFCDFVGALAENGELPRSDSILERITRAVCCGNARNWLNGREME